MKNQDALNFYSKFLEESLRPGIEKLSSKNDLSAFDAELILKYTTPDTKILDLGSGSGVPLKKIYKHVSHITAVESFKKLTDFIIRTPKIEIQNENISTYEPVMEYDMLTFFGIMQYFNEQESLFIYRKYIDALKDGGRIIVKNQFGIQQDVIISAYSPELKRDYFSEYRHVDKEVRNLKKVGFHDIDVIDIYPAECNRWPNTHFYAITGIK